MTQKRLRTPGELKKAFNFRFSQGKTKVALAIAEERIDRFPNDPLGYEQKCDVLCAKSLYKDALLCAEKSIELFTDNPAGHGQRAMILLSHLNRPRQALEIISNFTKQRIPGYEPNSAYDHVWNAYIAAEKGNDLVVRDKANILKLMPFSPLTMLLFRAMAASAKYNEIISPDYYSEVLKAMKSPVGQHAPPISPDNKDFDMPEDKENAATIALKQLKRALIVGYRPSQQKPQPSPAPSHS
ncbi:MAG: hypothetical protein L6Q57_03875 [Alphaproteobacteria bacterium]|nr:hypothetical protein [Alphaproteobacteria bacterium]